MSTSTEILEVALTALYLRGLERSVQPRRSRWPDVLGCIRRAAPGPDSLAEALRDGGHWMEALACETPGLLDSAAGLVARGVVLSAASDAYPLRWIEVLGGAAPPAMRVLGSVPPAPFLGIAGAREITSRVGRFTSEVAQMAVASGLSIVSGGARGCDRAAARGASGRLIEILPHGIDLHRAPVRGCILSAAAPGEEFSTGAAMERNALIYASGAHAFVGHARLKQGGAWTGATEAIRRRLTSLIVRRDDEDAAMRALASLGALPLDAPCRLGECLAASPVQARLHGL